MKRFVLFSIAMVLAFGCVVSSGAIAQTSKGQKKIAYPEKPITFIIPFGIGGVADISMRFIIDEVSKKLGTTIMAVNKAGAAGAVGLNDLLKAKPDGYTLGQQVGLATNKLLGVSPYNQKSVDMIGIVNADYSVITCYAKKPWTSIKELVDYAKSRPGEVTLSTNSKGSTQWIAAKVFESAAQIKLNIIPEPEAGGAVVTKVAGGHTDLGIQAFAGFKTQLEAGSIRLLGAMGKERLGGKYSQIPALCELGYDVEGTSTQRCVVGPKGLPRPIYDKLIQVFGEVAKSQAYANFLKQYNANPLWLPGEEGVKAYDMQEKLIRPILAEAGLVKSGK